MHVSALKKSQKLLVNAHDLPNGKKTTRHGSISIDDIATGHYQNFKIE